MSKKVSFVIIAIIIILGAIFYLVFGGKKSNQNAVINTPPQTVVSDTKNTENGSQISTASNSMELVSSLPGPTASASDTQAYIGKIQSIATTSASIDITGCSATPDILKAKPGDSITIVNKDSIPHTFSYPVSGLLLDPGATSPNVKLSIPKNGQTQLSLVNIPKGIYGIGCETATTTQGRIGILYVTP